MGWTGALLTAAMLWSVQVLQAAEIPGIVSTAGEGIRPSVGAESEDTISCLAVIYPYSTWEPSLNSSAKQPTSSPVPPYVEGSIDFSLVNTGANSIEAPWTLGIYNPQYTQVLQVRRFRARNRRILLASKVFDSYTLNNTRVSCNRHS